MSPSYHTTNSLLNVKTQSEGMTFSPVWEPKRSPGERCSSAQQYEPMNECFFFFSSETRPAFPLCVWEGWCFIHKIHKRVFIPVALIDSKTAREKSLNKKVKRLLAQGMWYKKLNGLQLSKKVVGIKGRKARKCDVLQSISIYYSSEFLCNV